MIYRNHNGMIRAGFAALAATVLLSGTVTAEDGLEQDAARPLKDETVYVISDAAGDVQDVIVNDWIKNTAQAETLPDVSSLQDIELLAENESFTEKDSGIIEWDTGGEDVYYQGKTQEALPVTIQVKYFLDGEEMSPEEIAGKSGEVAIRYEYSNELKKELEIDGVKSTLHVPFAVVTGTVLDPDVLHNAKITNGRIITDGDLTIAAGVVFPDLKEDLASPAYASLSRLVEADLPDYMEITGTTESFSWNTVYAMVTNELFSSGSEFTDGAYTATSKDASAVIDDVFGKLDSLKNGVGQIADGVSSLNEGAGQLKDGTQSLADGLGTLTEHNQELQDGAEQIFDGVLAGVQEQLTASGLDVKELTKDNYSAVLGMLKTFALGEDEEKLDGAIQQLNGLKAFCEGLNEYTNGVAQAKEGADELSEGTKTLQSGTTELLLGTTILKAALPDLSGVPEALKQSASLGQAYTSFSGLAEGMDGKVRFIWKLSGI